MPEPLPGPEPSPAPRYGLPGDLPGPLLPGPALRLTAIRAGLISLPAAALFASQLAPPVALVAALQVALVAGLVTAAELAARGRSLGAQLATAVTIVALIALAPRALTPALEWVAALDGGAAIGAADARREAALARVWAAPRLDELGPLLLLAGPAGLLALLRLRGWRGEDQRLAAIALCLAGPLSVVCGFGAVLLGLVWLYGLADWLDAWLGRDAAGAP